MHAEQVEKWVSSITDQYKASGLYTHNRIQAVRVYVLKLAPKIAPFKTGVFPLLSDKELIRVAKIIDGELRENGFQTYYDENGTIGRRYARMDEIGTPFCITVDHETLTDGKITVRNRDTTKQERVFIEHVQYYLKQKMDKKDQKKN